MRQDGTIPELLSKWALERPGDLFVWIGEERLTYGEFAELTQRVASGLRIEGVAAGDRVAIMCPTSPISVACLLGASCMGAIVVPMNIFLKGESLRHQLTDSGCRVVVTDESGFRLLQPLLGALPELKLLVVVGDWKLPDQHGDAVAITAETLLARGAAQVADDYLPNSRDTFAILYTSGTTGLPKGCVISHAYTEHWSRYTELFTGLSESDVIFTAAPQFHIGGITPVLAALSCGVPIVIEPAFSASKYLARAAETGATVAVGVGWIAQALLKQPASPSDRRHSLRVMSTVPLSVSDQVEFSARFGIRALTQQYGQTECYPVSFALFEESDVSPYSGPPCEQLVVEFHDDRGYAVPDGEVGQIVVRPRLPGVMFDRYWGDPERTLDALAGLWFHTGDMGRLREGQIQYVDRKKDSMRRRGENVSAYELEQLILRWPGVSEVAVHGVSLPDDLDEGIKACLVVTDRELDVEAMAGFLANELPYFAIPQFIELLPSLPRNAAGRVMKDQLRAQGVTPNTIDLVARGLGVGRHERRSVSRATGG